jgi:hypothetical protein
VTEGVEGGFCGKWYLLALGHQLPFRLAPDCEREGCGAVARPTLLASAMKEEPSTLPAIYGVPPSWLWGWLALGPSSSMGVVPLSRTTSVKEREGLKRSHSGPYAGRRRSRRGEHNSIGVKQERLTTVG